MKVRVIHIFEDKFSHELHNVGKEIEIEDEFRLNNLVSRNLVEIIGKKEAKTISLFESEYDKYTVIDAMRSIGMQVPTNIKDETIISRISELGPDKTAELKKTLILQ